MMKTKSKICLCILVLILSLIQGNAIKAEPSKNMRHLLKDSVSLLDFLCYRLGKELYDRYRLQEHGFTDILYEIATKIKDKELIARLERIKEYERGHWPPSFSAKVYFDFSSNCLTVDCASHSIGTDDKEEKDRIRYVSDDDYNVKYLKYKAKYFKLLSNMKL